MAKPTLTPEQFTRMLSSMGMIQVKQQKKREGYMTTREEISDFMWRGASMMMSDHEDHEPIAFYFGKNTMTTVKLGGLFGDDSQKDMAKHVMHTFAKELKPVAFAFVTGVWFKRIKAEKGIDADAMQKKILEEGVANQEGRMEAIMVSIETKGWSGIEMSEVTRGADGKVKEVVRKKEMDHAGHATGRFANILTQGSTLH